MHKDYAFDKSCREDVLTLRETLAKQYPDADISVDFEDDTVNLRVETDDEDVGKSIVADVEHNIYGPSDDEFDNTAALARAVEEGWSEDDLMDAVTQAALDAGVQEATTDDGPETLARELQDVGVDIAPYLNAENRSDYNEGESESESESEGEGEGGKDVDTDALIAKAKKAIATPSSVGQPSLMDQIKALPPEERKALLAQLSEDVPVDEQQRITASPKQQGSALVKLIGNLRF